MTEPAHPLISFLWPAGQIIGWERTFVRELHGVLVTIARGGWIRNHGAEVEDGYRAAVVCGAIVRSAARGTRHRIECLAAS